jgi:hypothetical protein
MIAQRIYDNSVVILTPAILALSGGALVLPTPMCIQLTMLFGQP